MALLGSTTTLAVESYPNGSFTEYCRADFLQLFLQGNNGDSHVSELYPIPTLKEQFKLTFIVRDESKSLEERVYAFERMVLGNRGLIVSKAARLVRVFSLQGSTYFEELMSVGLDSVVDDLLDSYDPDKGYTFGTYAGKNAYYKMLRWALVTIHPEIPVWLIDYTTKYSQIKALSKLHGENIEDEEMASRLGISLQKLEMVKSAIERNTIYELDADLTEDDERALLDTVEDKSTDVQEEVINTNLREVILEILVSLKSDGIPEEHRLSENEFAVLLYRFEIQNPYYDISKTGKHFTDIAKANGVSDATTQKWYNSAMWKLKQHPEFDELFEQMLDEIPQVPDARVDPNDLTQLEIDATAMLDGGSTVSKIRKYLNRRLNVRHTQQQVDNFLSAALRKRRLNKNLL